MNDARTDNGDFDYRRIAGNSLYLLAGTTVANLFTFASNVVLVRALTETETAYSEFLLTISVVTLAAVVSGFGLGSAYGIKRIARGLGRGNAQEAADYVASAGAVALVCAAGAAGLLLLGAGVVAGSLNSPIGTLLRAAILILVSQVALRLSLMVFAGWQRMRGSFLILCIVEPLKFVVLLVVVARGASARAALISWAAVYPVAAVAAVVVALVFLRRRGVTPTLSLAGVRDAAGAVPVALVHYVPVLGTVALGHVLRVLAGHYGSAADVATLGRCLPLPVLTLLILVPLGNALLPAASASAHTEEGRRRAAASAQVLLRWSAAVSLAVAAALLGGGRWILAALYNTAAPQDPVVLALIALGLCIGSQKVVLDPLLMAAGRQRSVAAAEVLRYCLVIAAGAVLIPRWGAAGAAVAYVGAYAVSTVPRTVACQWVTGRPLVWALVRLEVAVIVLAVAFGIGVDARLVGLGAAAAVLLTGSVRPGDFRTARALLRREEAGG